MKKAKGFFTKLGRGMKKSVKARFKKFSMLEKVSLLFIAVFFLTSVIFFGIKEVSREGFLQTSIGCSNCSCCLAITGDPNCDSACQKWGYTNGACANPTSTYEGSCCACYNKSSSSSGSSSGSSSSSSTGSSSSSSSGSSSSASSGSASGADCSDCLPAGTSSCDQACRGIPGGGYTGGYCAKTSSSPCCNCTKDGSSGGSDYTPPPPPPDCSKCLGKSSNCTEYCRNKGYYSGSCTIDGNTDTANCCSCSSSIAETTGISGESMSVIEGGGGGDDMGENPGNDQGFDPMVGYNVPITEEDIVDDPNVPITVEDISDRVKTTINEEGTKVSVDPLNDNDTQEALDNTNVVAENQSVMSDKEDNPQDIGIDPPPDPTNMNDPTSCFLPQEPINMADGSYKQIKDVKIGDLVKTYNQKTKKLENSPVEKIQTVYHDNVHELHLENGKVLKPTANHPFLTKKKGWATISGLDELGMGAEKLEVGDYVYTTDKNNNLSEVEVAKIVPIKGSYLTYNFIDMKNGTFVANDVVVHNSDNDPSSAPPSSDHGTTGADAIAGHGPAGGSSTGSTGDSVGSTGSAIGDGPTGELSSDVFGKLLSLFGVESETEVSGATAINEEKGMSFLQSFLIILFLSISVTAMTLVVLHKTGKFKIDLRNLRKKVS